MTKRQLIEEIITINHTAQPEFLARFEDTDLDQYLQHLRVLSKPRLSGDPNRYDKYFKPDKPAQEQESVPPVPVVQETQIELLGRPVKIRANMPQFRMDRDKTSPVRAAAPVVVAAPVEESPADSPASHVETANADAPSSVPLPIAAAQPQKSDSALLF